MLRRPVKSVRPLADLAGLAATLCLIAAPVFAVRAVSTAYQIEALGFQPGAEALSRTSAEIDRRIAGLIPRHEDRRLYWESRIAEALADDDFAAARGWLLAAPAVLKGETGEAIRAAAPADNEKARIEAALIQRRPERADEDRARTAPVAQVGRLFGAAAEGAITGRPDSPAHLAGAVTADFFVVGDIRDVVIQGGRWANGEEPDWFLLGISSAGLALTAATVATAGSTAPPKAGVSALKAAKRADALSPGLLRHFERSADAVLDASGLKAAGKAGRRSEDLIDGVRAAARSDAALKLSDDVAQVAAISKRVGPAGAMGFLETAESATDLRRARLVADAGGDRAIVLLKRAGPLALRAAKVGVKWSAALYAEIAGLVAAILGLIGSLAASLMRGFGRRGLKAYAATAKGAA